MFEEEHVQLDRPVAADFTPLRVDNPSLPQGVRRPVAADEDRRKEPQFPSFHPPLTPKAALPR